MGRPERRAADLDRGPRRLRPTRIPRGEDRRHRGCGGHRARNILSLLRGQARHLRGDRRRTIARLGMAIVRVDPARPFPHRRRSGARQHPAHRANSSRRSCDDEDPPQRCAGRRPRVRSEAPVFLRRDVEHAREDAARRASARRRRAGDVRLMSWLTMGALKEAMFQIVQRGAEYDEEQLVSGAFGFFCAGCFTFP